jgi:hypothetical protein
MATTLEKRYAVPVGQLHMTVLGVIGQHGRWTVQADGGPNAQVHFNTGLSIWSWSGQDMVVTTSADGETGSRLEVGGAIARRGMSSIQLVSWGEAGRIAKKLAAEVDAALGAGA